MISLFERKDMRYYKPVHFCAQEFLPMDTYMKYGADGLIIMDARILWTVDALRDKLQKPITINNWNIGGKFIQRGFRNDPTMLAETPLTQHAAGRAVDFDIYGMTAEAFRLQVKSGQYEKELQYVTRIEENTDWIHIDCASVPGTSIVFFHK
jgi:hypothetical protein